MVSYWSPGVLPTIFQFPGQAKAPPANPPARKSLDDSKHVPNSKQPSWQLLCSILQNHCVLSVTVNDIPVDVRVYMNVLLAMGVIWAEIGIVSGTIPVEHRYTYSIGADLQKYILSRGVECCGVMYLRRKK